MIEYIAIGVVIGVVADEIKSLRHRVLLRRKQAANKEHSEKTKAFYDALPEGYDHCREWFCYGPENGKTLEQYCYERGLTKPGTLPYSL